MNNIIIDITKTTAMQCACGSELFEPVTVLRKVPALLSPSGKEEIVPAPVYLCCRCKKLAPIGKKVQEVAETVTFFAKFLRSVKKLFRK